MNKTYMALRILLLIISVIGCILYIAAFAIPKWSKKNDGNDGLWQMCFLNGGIETCAVWPSHLISSSHKIAQILGCFGLVFYIIFVISGALTIFWTNRWKMARAIKYSTVVMAVLTVVFVMTCVFIYKNDKESSNSTVSIGWYLALIGGVFAAIAAPFYLIDACRTVAPPKPDKESLFNKFGNIPPKPTNGKFPDRIPDTFGRSNGGQPPLLSELRKQHTTFVHPPPKPAKKKITQKEIKALPLPPTKSKLNLFEKSEIENHPSPLPTDRIVTQRSNVLSLDDMESVLSPMTTHRSESITESSNDSYSIAGSIENKTNEPYIEHSVFKFHKTKSIQKNGKTMLKIQNESAKLPPVMMVMPGVDENEDDDEIVDGTKSRLTTNSSVTDSEHERARLKFAPYFGEVLEIPENSEKDQNPVRHGTKRNLNPNKTVSSAIKGRVKEMSGVYGDDKNPIKLQERPKSKKKSKKKKKSIWPKSNKSENVETCVNTYGNASVCSQEGVTIFNEIDENEADA